MSQEPNLVWNLLDSLLLIAFVAAIGAVVLGAPPVVALLLLLGYGILLLVRVYQVISKQAKPPLMWGAVGILLYLGYAMDTERHPSHLQSAVWLALALGALTLMTISTIHTRNARLKK